MVCLKMERGNGVELCMGRRFVNRDHAALQPDGGDALKGKRSRMEKGKTGRF